MNKQDEFVPIALDDDLSRCDWATRNNLELEYHDTEWGRPLFDERKLFENLMLQSLSAGLNWVTVLYNREDLRKTFDGFDPALIAVYDQNKVNELIKGAGVVRDRLKIHAVVNNAKAYFNLTKEHKSFSDFLWAQVSKKAIQNEWELQEEIPNSTPLAEKISTELQRYGFRLVGPPTVYSFLQAVGIVNDHVVDCYLHGAYK